MDYTASQQIANIVADMEPEDALTALLSNLRNLDVRVKVWVADDILSTIDEYYEDNTLTDEQKSLIVENVMLSYGWKILEDATNDDWDTINGEIQSAAHILGYSLEG